VSKLFPYKDELVPWVEIVRVDEPANAVGISVPEQRVPRLVAVIPKKCDVPFGVKVGSAFRTA
jgi:hypothetical protein